MEFSSEENGVNGENCVVHPEVNEPYPCSTCKLENSLISSVESRNEWPCHGCYFSSGEIKLCDGSCLKPLEEWVYFKEFPEDLKKMREDLGYE